jgi:hypothetical protein
MESPGQTGERNTAERFDAKRRRRGSPVPFTPKERNAIKLVIGLFILGCLVRAWRAYGGFGW